MHYVLVGEGEAGAGHGGSIQWVAGPRVVVPEGELVHGVRHVEIPVLAKRDQVVQVHAPLLVRLARCDVEISSHLVHLQLPVDVAPLVSLLPASFRVPQSASAQVYKCMC